MTTVTDDALEWYRDLSLNGNETVNKVAIGTGTSSESVNDSSLDNKVFEATVSDEEVNIETGSQSNEYVASIQIAGDNQVSQGTDITEFGIITSDGVLIARDVFNPVTISAGVTEAFNLSTTINR